MMGGQFQQKRRLVAGIEDPPGKGKASLVDFFRDKRIDSTQIGRGNNQPSRRSTWQTDRQRPWWRKNAENPPARVRDIDLPPRWALRQAHVIPPPWRCPHPRAEAANGHPALIRSIIRLGVRISSVDRPPQHVLNEPAPAHSFKV